MRDHLEKKVEEIQTLFSNNAAKDEEIICLKEEIKKISDLSPAQYASCENVDPKYEETERLRAEIKELREELSDMSLNDYSGVEPGRTQRLQLLAQEESLEDLEIQKLNSQASHENIYYSSELEKLRNELEIRSKQFETERITWAQEKEKVLRYQRQLQMNYVQMFRKTRALEAEIESLTLELELDKTGLKKSLDLSQTIEL